MKVAGACVPAVSLNGLNLPQSNPQPEGDHVSWGHRGPQEGRDPEEQDLGPVRVWRRVPDRRRVLVVNPVNLFVTPLVTMQEPVHPVIGVVLNHEIHQQLSRDFP